MPALFCFKMTVSSSCLIRGKWRERKKKIYEVKFTFNSVISDQHTAWAFENFPLASCLKPSVQLCCWESLSQTCETKPKIFLLLRVSPGLSLLVHLLTYSHAKSQTLNNAHFILKFIAILHEMIVTALLSCSKAVAKVPVQVKDTVPESPVNKLKK